MKEAWLHTHTHTCNEAHRTKTAKQAHWENIHISSNIYAPGTDCHLALGAKGVSPGEGGDKAHKPHTQYWGHEKSFNGSKVSFGCKINETNLSVVPQSKPGDSAMLQCNINDKPDHISFKAVYGCTKGHRSIVNNNMGGGWLHYHCMALRAKHKVFLRAVVSIMVLLWLLTFHTFHSESNRDVTCHIPHSSHVKVSSLEITASITWQKEGKGLVWLIFHALRTYLICQHQYSICEKM